MKSFLLCFLLFGVLGSTIQGYVTEEDASNEMNRPDAVHLGGRISLRL